MVEYNMRRWLSLARVQIDQGLQECDGAAGDKDELYALMHRPMTMQDAKEPIFAVRTATGYRLMCAADGSAVPDVGGIVGGEHLDRNAAGHSDDDLEVNPRRGSYRRGRRRRRDNILRGSKTRLRGSKPKKLFCVDPNQKVSLCGSKPQKLSCVDPNQKVSLCGSKLHLCGSKPKIELVWIQTKSVTCVDPKKKKKKK